MRDEQWERLLQQGLRRVEPPAGFAERVLARVPQELAVRRKPAAWRTWTALAATVTLALSTWSYQQYRREREAREQAEKLAQALAITHEQLAKVQALVNKAGQRQIRLGEN